MSRKLNYEAAGALYLAGRSLKQIAVELGVEDETVRRALKLLGIARRPRGSSAGKGNHQFKGGTRKRRDGYVIVRGSRAKPHEHRIIAERALGRPLKLGEVVHHIDGNRSNNANSNLLICTQAYHMALHARMKRRS